MGKPKLTTKEFIARAKKKHGNKYDYSLVRYFNFKNKVKIKCPIHGCFKQLPFDFYLPNHNTCIEFHGQQHYKPISWFGGETMFKSLKKRDKLKANYCLKNNIRLIIINNKDEITNVSKLLI